MICLQGAESVETISCLIIEAKDFSDEICRLYEILRVIVLGDILQLVDDIFSAVLERFIVLREVPNSLRDL